MITTKLGLAAAFVGAALVAAAPAIAESVKTTTSASNGVRVEVFSDEFANRYEYAGPDVGTDGSYAWVSRVDRAGAKGPISISGIASYRGEWRFYNSAVFRGGDSAEFVQGSRDVGSCSGGRYSRGCSLTETYHVRVAPEQIEKYSVNGILEIQVRSQRGEDIMLRVPVDQFAAVSEVADSRTATRP